MIPRSFFARIIAGLFLLNTGLAAAGLLALHSPPLRGIQLTPRSDGLLVHGDNIFGLRAYLAFRNWEEVEAYFAAHHLELPLLSYAEQGHADDIRVSATPTAPTYKIVWHQEGRPQVMFTPDRATAELFASHLHYGKLDAGSLGYSLNVRAAGR